MERLPVAAPPRGSDFRGKATLNDGLGETDLQQSGAVQLGLLHKYLGVVGVQLVRRRWV